MNHLIGIRREWHMSAREKGRLFVVTMLIIWIFAVLYSLFLIGVK